MNDGRNDTSACPRLDRTLARWLVRPGAVIAAAVSASLALATAPAAAADSGGGPGTDTGPGIASAQARYDRLARQSAEASRRQDRVAGTLAGDRSRVTALTARLRREQATMASLQLSLAALVGDPGSTGSAGETGYVAGRRTAGPSATPVDQAAQRLLTNVAVVSQDTHGLSAALAGAADRIERLQRLRASIETRLQAVSERADRVSRSAERLSARADAANAVLSRARATAYQKRVGPAVAYALSKVGDAYVWGGAGPDTFDCSGLTMMAWQQAGVSLPHNSTAQYSSGQRIPESELKPGDLVFYYTPISHVGIYVGNGKVVGAQNPSTGVQVTGLHDMPYVGAVRPG